MNLVGTNFSEKKTACIAVNDLLINYYNLIVNDSEHTAADFKTERFCPLIRLTSRS